MALFSEDRVLGSLKQSLGVDVKVDGDVLILHTMLGDLFVEFSHGLDGQYICPVAVFRDLDEHGKKRDVYAVKLNIERGAWTDSNGRDAHVDFVSGRASSGAPYDLVQAALVRKLKICEQRFANLKS